MNKAGRTGYHQFQDVQSVLPVYCLLKHMEKNHQHVRQWQDLALWITQPVDAYLYKLLNGLYNISVELFDLYSSEVHVTEQTVDDLEERLLHARKALFQQLRR